MAAIRWRCVARPLGSVLFGRGQVAAPPSCLNVRDQNQVSLPSFQSRYPQPRFLFVSRSVSSSSRMSSSSSSSSSSTTSYQHMDCSETEETKEFDQQLSVKPISPAHYLRGRVVKGFQRGSKLLGCPTANLDPAAFRQTLNNVPRGVYCGFAKVDFKSSSQDQKADDTNKGSEHSEVYPTVLSLGYNPTFGTKEETVEAYILHQYPHDFYDQQMSLIICGYLRESLNFSGLDELIKWMKRDVRVGVKALQSQPLVKYKDDPFFSENNSKSVKDDGQNPSVTAKDAPQSTSAPLHKL